MKATRPRCHPWSWKKFACASLLSWREEEVEEQSVNLKVKDYPKAMLAMYLLLYYVTEPDPAWICISRLYFLCKVLSSHWSINCFHAWYYLEENSHFVFSRLQKLLTSLGNWDWIQFEELKCLHTKELISFPSKLATIFENCKIYSLRFFFATKKGSQVFLDDHTC